MYVSRHLPFLFGVVLCASACAFGQEVSTEDAKAIAKEWLAERTKEFESYRFELEGPKPKALDMESRSLLNWSNAERGTYFGAVFLWTEEGRPALIANAFGRGQFLRHEFHSLSTQPIVAESGGSRVHRFRAGIEWSNLPDAPEPDASRALRLAQMRRQAERFRVTIVMQRPMGIEEPAEVRLLTQPAYRSGESAAGDVAVFLFVQGTDPECVLLLEATADKKWRYALTRQTKAALRADLDGKQVLDLPQFGRMPADPESAFFVLTPPAAAEGR
ncbi:MAG: hypothetical protein L0211_23455 [Planctomycetaceae bacterium]|nr:hypothetical protein [Planctomycetaceae bacterium]